MGGGYNESMNPNNGKAQAEVAPGFEMEAPVTVPRFNREHKKWIIDCLIDSVPYQSMSKVFRVIFPNFAPNVPDEKFHHIVKNRFRDYRHKYKDEIDKGRNEVSDGIGHIPVTKQRVRLEYAQLIAEEWHPKSLIKVIETKDGQIHHIYKDNSKELIALFRFVREELGETTTDDSEDLVDKIAREAREKYPVIETNSGRTIPDDSPPADTDDKPLMSEQEMEEFGYRNRN